MRCRGIGKQSPRSRCHSYALKAAGQCALAGGEGRFLFRAGRLAEARSEFRAAAALTRNLRERAFLLARADACGCEP